jgi:hypothetical protein
MRSLIHAIVLLPAILMSACSTTATSNERLTTQPRLNPSSSGNFTEAVPSKVYLSWGSPINHPEPQSVQAARFQQMEAFAKAHLEQQGYKVYTVREGFPPKPFGYVAMEYDTTPSVLRDARWVHSISFRFSESATPRYLGACRATWRDYASDSIDAVLSQLTLLALQQVPKAEP